MGSCGELQAHSQSVHSVNWSCVLGVFFFPKGDFHFPWVICMYIEMRFFNLNGPGVSFSSKLITQQHTDLLKVYVCVSRKNPENNKMSKWI